MGFLILDFVDADGILKNHAVRTLEIRKARAGRRVTTGTEDDRDALTGQMVVRAQYIVVALDLMVDVLNPWPPSWWKQASSQEKPGGEVKIKLMDFGLAFHSGATRLTQEDMLVGTITYLAPELIEGQAASASSDLYALGVVLY